MAAVIYGLLAITPAYATPLSDCLILHLHELLEVPLVDNARHIKLWKWLRQPSVDGPKIISFLSHDPKIKDLFSQGAGVWEGYTIEQHTKMVYDIFEEQLPYFPIGKIPTPTNIDIPNLMKFTVALHDIGKPLAIKAGNKALQHIYTLPIMVDMMEKVGFSKAEIDIAKSIVNNDVLGDLMKGVTSPADAHKKVVELASHTSLRPKDYFKLQSFFYTIDAASYPSLRQRIFREVNGVLTPGSPRYSALAEMFGGP